MCSTEKSDQNQVCRVVDIIQRTTFLVRQNIIQQYVYVLRINILVGTLSEKERERNKYKFTETKDPMYFLIIENFLQINFLKEFKSNRYTGKINIQRNLVKGIYIENKK